MHGMRVLRNEPAGLDLRHLVLDRPADGHEHVGQYVQVGPIGGEVSFFALANRPGQPVELLVKAVGEAAEAIADTPVGGALMVTDALGPGFPLDAVAGRELVVLVNGSGISAARPVVEAEVAAGLTRPVHVFYGVFSEAHVSFGADLERWRQSGVHVHVVLHQDGFVQDAAIARGLLRDDVALVLVGHPAMLDDARARWTAVGLAQEAVLTNF